MVRCQSRLFIAQSRPFTAQSRLFTASLDCPHTCARVCMCPSCMYIRVQYTQESIMCAGAHSVCRCLWCVQVSQVCEEVPVCMYRSALGLVCRAVHGVHSHTSAVCRSCLCIHRDARHGVWTVLADAPTPVSSRGNPATGTWI